MILHTFGWAITIETEGNNVISCYPARVKYRGFGERNNTEGYRKVSQYLQENAVTLSKESSE